MEPVSTFLRWLASFSTYPCLRRMPSLNWPACKYARGFTHLQLPWYSKSTFPLAAGAFVAPFLFLSSMHVFVRDGLYSDAWRVNLVLQVAKAMAPKLILPIIAFWGVLLLAVPLYGFSFFLGIWVLLAYSSALNFSKINQD